MSIEQHVWTGLQRRSPVVTNHVGELLSVSRNQWILALNGPPVD